MTDLLQPRIWPPSPRLRYGLSVESRTGAVTEGVGSGCCRPLLRLAGVSVHAMAPFPIPAHRTGRAGFPHPALRLVSRSGTRRGPQLHPSQSKDPQFSEDPRVREVSGASRLHLVAASQKVPNTALDVVVVALP